MGFFFCSVTYCLLGPFRLFHFSMYEMASKGFAADSKPRNLPFIPSGFSPIS